MYAGYNWPERFGCVLSQSGSFWWPDVALLQQTTDIIHGRQPGLRGWLTQQIEQQPIAKPLNVYLEAGTREGEMIDLSESLSWCSTMLGIVSFSMRLKADMTVCAGAAVY